MRHPEERKCGKEKNSEEEKKEGGMPLIKTLSQALKMDKERFQVPKSVQQAVPIRRIWPDGIFQVGNKYSKSFRFTDINYAIVLLAVMVQAIPFHRDQQGMFKFLFIDPPVIQRNLGRRAGIQRIQKF